MDALFPPLSPFSIPSPSSGALWEKASETKGERGGRERKSVCFTLKRGLGLQRHTTTIPPFHHPSFDLAAPKRHTSSILFRIDNEICSPLPIPIPHTLPSPRGKKNHPHAFRRGKIEAGTEWVY